MNREVYTHSHVINVHIYVINTHTCSTYSSVLLLLYLHYSTGGQGLRGLYLAERSQQLHSDHISHVVPRSISYEAVTHPTQLLVRKRNQSLNNEEYECKARPPCREVSVSIIPTLALHSTKKEELRSTPEYK